MHTPRRAFLPVLAWASSYDRSLFRSDLIAGLTVAVMLIPQAMAYAALAGMPPVTGLYASLVPLVAYALFGTSGQLAVGPVALISLLTASGLAPYADGDPSLYIEGAALLALMVGGIHILLGLIRAGTLVNFLSHPVISGFTSAAALVIGLSQVRALLGLDLPRPHGFVSGIIDILSHLGQLSPTTTLIGLGGVLVLALGRRRWPALPWPLLVVILATIGVTALGWETRVVGTIPSGLPSPGLPDLSISAARSLLPTALTIALIGYLEGVSVAKRLAAKSRQTIEPDQELLAIGAANLSAGLFGAFPVAGGFSRSAVSHQAGSRTVFSGVITAAVIALTLLFFTPLFRQLPTTILSAIIIVAVAGLIDLAEPRRALQVRRTDFITWLVTFGSTLLIDVELGIAIGAGFSLLAFIHRSAQPHITELGRVLGTTDTFRNVDRFPTATDPMVHIVRIDGPLYFANTKSIADWFTSHVAESPHCRVMILDASAISDIDSSSIRSILEMEERLADVGVEIHVATVRGPVRDLLRRAGIWQQSLATTHEDVLSAVRATAGDDSPLRVPSDDETLPPDLY